MLPKSILCRRTCLLLATMVLAGCAGGEDFSYVPANEIKPGSGLLSGRDGAFTLLGPSEGAAAKQQEAAKAGESSAPPPAP